MAINRPIAGVDLGGTNMQIGVVSPEGRLLGRSKKKTRADEGSARVIQRIIDGIHEACVEAKVSPRSLAGVGIGAPGALDPSTGTVREAPNLRWRDVPLAKIIKRKLDKDVVVDNDVRAAAFGEYKLGAGRGAHDLLALWIGTGIGGGIILHGRLLHGATNTAGEIGHTTLFPGSPPGSRSLEQNCSRTAIVDRLVRLIRTNHPSIIPELADGDISDIKARIVAQAYAKGDKLTRDVVENAAWMLGVGAANAVTLLGLQRVVIGGGLTEAMGETLVALIRDSVRKHAFPEVVKRVEVVMTKLEADAGLLGAAMLARERLASRAAREAAAPVVVRRGAAKPRATGRATAPATGRATGRAKSAGTSGAAASGAAAGGAGTAGSAGVVGGARGAGANGVSPRGAGRTS
jgi:glucokinase